MNIPALAVRLRRLGIVRWDGLLVGLTFGLLIAACTTPYTESTSSDDGGGGGNGCQPGYCNSNGACCPSSHRYYCEGSCYATSNEANAASSGRCHDWQTVC